MTLFQLGVSNPQPFQPNKVCIDIRPAARHPLQAYLTEALAAMVATLGGGRLQGGPLLPALLAGMGVRLDSPDALVRCEFSGFKNWI